MMRQLDHSALLPTRRSMKHCTARARGAYSPCLSFSRTLRLASTSAAPAAACAVSRPCRRAVYSGSVSQWVTSPFNAASSPTTPERSRAVSLVTSFGSCGPIYDSDTPRRASRLTSHTEQRLPIPHPQDHQSDAHGSQPRCNSSNHEVAYQQHAAHYR